MTGPMEVRLYGFNANDAGGGRSAADRRGCRPEAKGQQGLGLGSFLPEMARLFPHTETEE